jgi:cytochrome P450
MPPIYNPFLPEFRDDPYPFYRELRESDPVQFNPHAGIWALSRHADCVSVLRDRRLSSELAHKMRRRQDPLPRSMLSADGPEHARLRAPVARVFTRARIQRVREDVSHLAATMLAGIGEAEDVEVIAEFARPLVTQAFVDMLGIPDEEADRFGVRVADSAVNLDPLAVPERQAPGAAAARAMSSLFGELVSERARVPGDHIPGALADVAATGEGFTHDDVLATCNLLVIGGHDPAVHLIGNGLLALLRHPDQLQRIRDDPSRIRVAVDELLRYDPPIQLASRVALEDVEVGGMTLRRGAAVLVLIGSANHDPAVFANPDSLDIERAPNPHIAFGSGSHLCLGASVARVIAESALEGLLRAWPDACLAAEEPEWCDALVPRGLRKLAVELHAKV